MILNEEGLKLFFFIITTELCRLSVVN